MFLKAMIATDLYTAYFPVEKCIRGLKELGIKEYFLLQLLEKTRMPGINLDMMKESLQETLDKHKQVAEKEGVNVEAEVVTGKTSAEINKIAFEKKCSLIVFGTYKHTRAWELLLGGGMSSHAVYHQIMPVLLVPLEPYEKQIEFIREDRCEFLNNVLFSTDFSKNSAYAFQYLQGIIEKGPKQVTLLHVQNKTMISPHLTHRLEEFNKKDSLRLEKLREELTGKSKVDIDIEVRYGHPVREILEMSKSRQISLVVMGSQGRGFLKEAVIGSISQNIARLSNVPVLLIPMPERDYNNSNAT